MGLPISWYVNQYRPCPVCGGVSACRMTEWGQMWCLRRHSDQPGWNYVCDTRIGFGVFWPDEASECVHGPYTHSKGHVGGLNGKNGGSNGHANGKAKKSPVIPPIDSAVLAKRLEDHQAGARERRRLAEQLGVRADSLKVLRMGYVAESEREVEHWIFPERDDLRRVVGILRRYPDGRKLQMPGTRRGVIFDPDWEPDVSRPVLVVEGPSDVAAGLTLGLQVVGRPSNLGGVEELSGLLERYVRFGGRVIVLGENDQKADGQWPGKEGAERVVQGLAERLGGGVVGGEESGCVYGTGGARESDHVPELNKVTPEIPDQFDRNGEVRESSVECAYWRALALAMPPDGVKDLRAWLCGLDVDVENVAECEKAGAQILQQIQQGSLIYCRLKSSILIEGGVGGPIDDSVQTLSGHRRLQTTRYSHADIRLSAPSIPQSAQQIIDAGVRAGPCRRHFTPLLQGRTNPRKGLTVQAACGRYECPDCGPVRLCRWMVHLLCLFDQQSVGGLHLWQGKDLRGGHGVFRRQLQRTKTNFAAILDANGTHLFICDKPVPVHSKLLTSPIDATTAADLIAQTMGRLASVRRPITSSRPWQLPDRPPPKADYIRRGQAGHGAFPEVVAHLERHRMHPHTADVPPCSARADWEWPEDWPEERIDWGYDLLQAIKAKQPSSPED